MTEFKNVNKVFHKKRETIQALKNVSFKIDQHDVSGVISYSSTGKSTLVRLVSQLETVSDGQVAVDGHEIDTYKKKDLRGIKKNVGMILQHFNLLNSKSVYRSVTMPLILSKTSRKGIKEKVDEILEPVGLTSKRDQLPDELSGGQKQRVAIARALVTHPKILSCGEATNALDPAITSSILDLLSNANRAFGVTTMIVMHEVNVIQRICHRIAVMENGEAIRAGTVRDALSHPQTNAAKDSVSTVTDTKPSKELWASFNSRKDSNFTDYRLFLNSE